MPHQLLLHSDGRARRIEQRSVRMPPFFGIRDDQIRSISRSLEMELNNGCPSGRIFGEQLGSAFASYLAVHYSRAAPMLLPSRRGLPMARLARILEHIDQHLGDDCLTVDGLASLIGLSGPRLGNLFKESMGQPPHTYINIKRMERAKKLLLESNLSIAEIAFEVGFSNQSSFTDRFRRIVGMPPGRFRDEGR